MVLNPFVAGILCTIFVEMAVVIILAIIRGGKNK
jgi:formate/nitrite transporter FocA (FNT family)